MGLTACDIMKRCFFSLHPRTPISEALELFRNTREEMSETVVVDEEGTLLGMVSIQDLLHLVRPHLLPLLEEMEERQVAEFLHEACRRARAIQVRDIMTTDLVTITPETHLVRIVELMTSRGLRRLPVVCKDKVVGMVYRANVMYHLVEGLFISPRLVA